MKLSDSERKIYDDLSRAMMVDLKDKEIDAVNAASLSNKTAADGKWSNL